MKILNSIKIGILLLTLLSCSQIFAETSTTTRTTSPTSTTATPDDATISSDVLTKLSQDNSLAGANITISIQQGVVTMSGTVNNQAQADAAVAAAKSVAGVKDVKSNIVVK